jgi:hypothetical protein
MLSAFQPTPGKAPNCMARDQRKAGATDHHQQGRKSVRQAPRSNRGAQEPGGRVWDKSGNVRDRVGYVGRESGHMTVRDGNQRKIGSDALYIPIEFRSPFFNRQYLPRRGVV